MAEALDALREIAAAQRAAAANAVRQAGIVMEGQYAAETHQAIARLAEVLIGLAGGEAAPAPAPPPAPPGFLGGA